MIGDVVMKKAPATVICSLPELPHDMRGELHPTRPWLIYCIDANTTEGVPASAIIFDYATGSAVRTITSDPEPAIPDTSPAVSPHLSTMPDPGLFPQAPPQSPQRVGASSRMGPCLSPQASPARMSRLSISVSSAVPVTPPRSVNKNEAQKAAGSIRMVRFYDADVRAWKDYMGQQSLPFQTPATMSVAAARREQLTMTACSTLVVLVYDTRIVLYNYISCEKKTIYNSSIGSKVTAMDVLTNMPAIALGGRDGAVRIWDPEEMTTVATLTGGIRSGTAVTQLHAFTAKDGKPCLLCGAADGTVTLWDLSRPALIGSSRVHGGPVHDISYSSLLGCAYTVSADRTLATWTIQTVATSSEASESFGLVEKSVVSVGKIPYLQVSPWGLPQYFSDSLLVLRKDSTELTVTYPEKATFEPLLSTTDLVTVDITVPVRRESLVQNIVSFTVHPTRPDILLLSTTKGVLLTQIRCPPDFRVCNTNAMFSPKEEALAGSRPTSGCCITPPSTSPALPANHGKKNKRASESANAEAGHGKRRSRTSAAVARDLSCCMCLFEQNHYLVCCDIAHMLRMGEKRASATLSKAGSVLQSSPAFLPVATHLDAPKELFALQSSDCIVTLSSDKRGIVVQYRDVGKYEVHVFDDSTQLWTVTSEGAYARSVFAASASYIVLQEAFDSPLTVQTYGVLTPDVILTVPAAKANKVTQLFGGKTLVGVVTEVQSKKPTEDSDANPSAAAAESDSSELTTEMQFFAWDKLLDPAQRVGPTFSPAPDSVVWDKSGTRVALLYSKSGAFELYSYNPERIESPIQLLRRYEGRYPASLLWSDAHPFVFTSTRDAILCDFYNMLDGPVTLASRTALSTPRKVVKTRKDGKPGKMKASDMAIQPLPRGDLTLVNVAGKQLIAMDSSRVFYSFLLSSSIFRFLDSLCAGAVDRAIKITKKIDDRYHSILSKYLIASGHAPEVLSLTGVSDWDKLRHCHRFGMYAEAVPLVKSLVEQLHNGPSEEKAGEIKGYARRAVPVSSRALMRVVASMAAELRRQPHGDKNEIADDLLSAAYNAAPATATLLTALHYVEAGYSEDIKPMILPPIEQSISAAAKEQEGSEEMKTSPVTSNVWQMQSSALFCHVLTDDDSGVVETWTALSHRPAQQ